MRRLLRQIPVGRAVLLALAIGAVGLFTADTASAEWEYFLVTVQGNYQLGGEITATVSGTATAPTRVFVYAESTKCAGTPAREEAAASSRRLTPLEGEPVGPGKYTEVYTYKVATAHPLSGICDYVGTFAPSRPYHDTLIDVCEQKPNSSFAADNEGCSIPGVFQTELRELEEVEHPEAQEVQEQAERAIEAERSHNEAQLRQTDEASKRTADSHCAVPGLRGHTLHGSRGLLSRSHCSLGRVRIRSGGQGPLSVIAQTPKRGTMLPSGGHVSLTLGRSSR